MQTVKLSGSSREKSVGKKGLRALRMDGLVPAVLYGGKDQVSLAFDKKQVSKLVFTPNVYQLDLELDGGNRKAIIQEVQFHPVTDEILHIDLLELFEDKQVKVKLPVRIVGNSIGVRNGGKLLVNFRKIDVKALPSALPEAVEVDISPLRIGFGIRIKEVNLNGVTLLSDPNAMLVQVAAARGAAKGSDDADGAEGDEAATETAEA